MGSLQTVAKVSMSWPSYSIFHLVFCLAVLASTNPAPQNGALTDRSSDPISIERRASASQSLNVSARLPRAGFAFEVTGGVKPLSDRECFGITISALADLAHAPFYSQFPSTRYYQLPGHLDLVLILAGHLNKKFHVKYMIWGLTTAIKHMVDNNQFRDWRFILSWRNKPVGTISFFHVTPSVGIPWNDTAVTQNRTESGLLEILLGITSPSDLTVSFYWVPGNDLNLSQVMMVIVGGLTDLAIYDIHQEISGSRFVTIFVPYRTRFGLHIDTRSAPAHWFTYEIVCATLLRIASFYLEHQACKPLYMQLWTNQQFVATGALTTIA